MKNNYESLTQSQSLLWIGQEMNPESPMYNMVMTYELKVPISVVHFKMAFQALINRYDALRSVFQIKEGTPTQVFLQEHTHELEIIDFSKEENPIQAYKHWQQASIIKPFNISVSVLDSALIKLNKSHYIWYINQHHLITDAWSNSLLFSAITHYYQEYKNGADLSEIQNETSFKAYIQQERLERTLSKNDTAKEYWAQKISNCPPTPNLYNNPQSTIGTESTRLYINLGLERSKKLRALANEKGVRVWTEHLSLYNIFLTTLFVYLYRVSGQEQLTIGSPTHNRISKKIKETVGFFVEVFPLFATIDKEETFLSLLQKIQVESNHFLKHAKPGISTSDAHRSFNVLFNYIHADYTDFDGVPVRSEWVHSGHHDPRHHIRLHVHDLHNTGEIQLYFDLNDHVFDTQKQALIPQHFNRLLDAFITHKEQAIALPSIVSKQEQENTFSALHQNIDATTAYDSILSQIEQQVVKTPLEPSIVFGEEIITYQELNEKVNQFAHYLLEQNIGVNSQVAIWLKRSPAYIISVLAVLKTGATYIPIPYNYPIDRVAYMIADSEALLLIGHEDKQLNVLKDSQVNTLSIDSLDTTVLSTYSNTNPLIKIPKETVAFLIYTSGSTGHPKGVKITHGALSNYIQWTKEAYITAHDIQKPSIPLFTTVGFDITANAVFLPLICGGSIHAYQERDTEVDLSIIDVVEDNKVSFIKLTPAHVNFIKDKELSHSAIEVIVVTGDEFKTALGIDMLSTFNNQVHIYNEYGPSEATIGCIYHKFNSEIDIAASVPIGLPIRNMQVYILDRFLNPVPQGVIGELYLGGTGLSSGYWNRPELTRTKFVQNPFQPNTTLYRTEDLVRLNDQGIIEFLGRTDFQVKINGYRIELGEIEACLLSYTAINACTVIVSKNEEGFKSLAAYFSVTTVVDLKELQQFLSQKLPKYMVPMYYKQLENLPLSPNGKVDRKALALIDAEAVQSTHEYIAPRNEIEEEVASIWCSVFNLTKIGVYDSFIELGGESLMAIQITTRINETFEFKMPLNKIFELKTIAHIASYIEETLISLLQE
ncbi:amino acid adenylation domain-containing protein [uncultured Dokdonia sp.]|uniref:non-ribosomal peptide synthetase n=1 Tax=uncultured Dokdonia sp. TaxID=575653 RepID=UPI002625EDEA|nr:amino acid adenylation domain-containing protein [uncultured Dokdonia sp.]